MGALTSIPDTVIYLKHLLFCLLLPHPCFHAQRADAFPQPWLPSFPHLFLGPNPSSCLCSCIRRLRHLPHQLQGFR